MAGEEFSMMSEINARRRSGLGRAAAAVGGSLAPTPAERADLSTREFGVSPATAEQKLAARTYLAQLKSAGVLNPDANTDDIEIQLTREGHDTLKALYESTTKGRAADTTAEARLVAANRPVRQPAGPKPPPGFDDLVAKQAAATRQNVALLKQGGKLPANLSALSDEDFQLQAELTTGLTRRNDPKYPEARFIGDLAAKLEPYRNDQKAYLNKFAEVYAQTEQAARANPAAFSSPAAKRYLAMLQRMRGRVQPGSSFLGFQLSAPSLTPPVPTNP